LFPARIVSLLGGLRPALLSTSFAGCIRFIGWSLAPNAWMVLPFECGHGWSFALAYTSMSSIGDLFAPVGLQATVVGLLSSCLGLGNLTATLGWGLVVETVGLRASFGAAAGVFGLAAVLPLLMMSAARLSGRQRGSSRAVGGLGDAGQGGCGAIPGGIEKTGLVSHQALAGSVEMISTIEGWGDGQLDGWAPTEPGSGSRKGGAGGDGQQLGVVGVRAELAPADEV
jgi:hypothetical protein